jgi:hypothetical protein
MQIKTKMSNDDFLKSKRAFWLFCLLSAALWIIPFFIRIFLIDCDDIGLVPQPKETVQSEVHNIVTEIVSISVLFVPGISVKMCQSERWCNSTKKMLFAC